MRLQKHLNEAPDPIFDAESADELVSKLKSGVKVPFINAYKSTLGGPQNVSVLVKLSLDEKNTWMNNIFENSRYAHFHVTRPNVIEMFQRSYKIKTKFRKTRAKSIDDVVSKINDWAKKAMKE